MTDMDRNRQELAHIAERMYAFVVVLLSEQPGPLTPVQRDFVETLVGDAQRMDEIVRDLSTGG